MKKELALGFFITAVYSFSGNFGLAAEESGKLNSVEKTAVSYMEAFFCSGYY